MPQIVVPPLVSKKAILVEEIFTERYGFLKCQGDSIYRLNKQKFAGIEAQQAIKWGVSHGWLTTKPKERTWSWFVGDPVYLLEPPTVFFLDTHIIWELIYPAIARCGGFAITKAEEWLKLGIEPNGTRYFRDSYLDEMVTAINKLARENYVWFQTCGDVWRIEIRAEREVMIR